MKPTTIGMIKGMVTDRNGRAQMKVTLSNVVYTPSSQYNLLSLTKMMSDGWTLNGNKHHLKIEKNGVQINFDITIKTKRGQLFCVNIQREMELANAAIEISKQKAHRVLGHSSNEATIKTANALGWKLTGYSSVCESC